MELTETRPETSNSAVVRAQPTGLAGILGTGDHKVIGRLFVLAALGVTAASEVVATIIRADTYDTKSHQLLSQARFDSLQSLQPTGIVFIGLIPLLLGIALIVVPLQIGSRSVAFPRAAAVGFWTYFVGGGLFIASYFIEGGPAGTKAEGVELWALALIMVLVASIIVAVTIVTTVFTHRAPGMTMTRVPMFAWSMVVAGIIWTLSLPIVAGLLLLLFVDLQHGSILSANAEGAIFSQVSWALHQPQVYAVAIPAFGIIADIVTTFSRARDEFRRSITMGMVALFGILSFGAYTITSFAQFPVGTVEKTSYFNPVVIFASLLIVLPVLGLLGSVADSMRRGSKIDKPVVGAPLPIALVAALLLLAAVLVGVLDPIQRLNIHGTLYTDGQFQLVMGATIMAAAAGLFYWSSKIVGAKAANMAGYAVALLGLLGTLGLAGGNILAVIGADAQQRAVGTEAFNALAALGAAGITGAVFVTGFALASAIRNRHRQEEADTWGAGQTLEWATQSPPIYENFVEIPPVRSEAPLLDELTTEEETV